MLQIGGTATAESLVVSWGYFLRIPGLENVYIASENGHENSVFTNSKFKMVMFYSYVNVYQVNGNSRILKWSYQVPYFWSYFGGISPYICLIIIYGSYLQFRILEFPLTY